MKTKIFSILFLGFAVFLAGSAEALSVVPPPYGGAICSFTRDLGQGMYGEDVRCLQQYLSTYVSGGYSGYQRYVVVDGYYGPMTTQAVMQWQTSNGIYPAYGYFDAASRARYFELVGYGSTGGGYPTTSEEQRARQRISEALRMMEDAQDEIDDSHRNISRAQDELDEAEDDMLDAIFQFFVKMDFRKAYNLADDALKNAEDAFEDAGGDLDNGGGDREDAKDAIEDAEDAIDDAEDDISDARRRGVSIILINRAEDKLDDARDRLDDADDEYDDEDYDDAEDLAQEAEDLAQDASDEVN